MEPVAVDVAFAGYAAEIARVGRTHAALTEATGLDDFLSRHVAELVAHRHLPREWPGEMRALIGPTVWAEAMALLDNPRLWTWQNCYVTTTGRKRA